MRSFSASVINTSRFTGHAFLPLRLQITILATLTVPINTNIGTKTISIPISNQSQSKQSASGKETHKLGRPLMEFATKPAADAKVKSTEVIQR
uniref:Uncharacterized protein n=1 Tax=Panagrellus redivivus TaxID=6233 RepID=A0A7E4V3U9_PANRE